MGTILNLKGLKFILPYGFILGVLTDCSVLTGDVVLFFVE